MNKTISSILVLALLAGGFAWLRLQHATAESSPPKPKAPPYKLVAPLGVIMDTLDEKFYEMEELMETQPPRFKSLYKDSLLLAELANVTGFACKSTVEADKKLWNEYATAVREGLLKMAASSREKKMDAVKKQWTAVEKGCDSCHDKFEEDYPEEEE